PEAPFIVEVDASSCGIVAVLSQHQQDSGKLHPCTYFSRKLTTAEANYDVGNHELLSIKPALEEWRHWLEGARHPFLVLTNRRNLDYLQGAKCLNPCQARWAFFFTRFNFSVTYRPGSKNAPIQWNLMEEIRRAHTEEAPPTSCQPAKLYVPSSLHLRVLQWIYKSPSDGHPMIHRTTQLTQRQFWWPSLGHDVSSLKGSPHSSASWAISLHYIPGLGNPLTSSLWTTGLDAARRCGKVLMCIYREPLGDKSYRPIVVDTPTLPTGWDSEFGCLQAT
ncbi:hypothetical protein QTP70_015888, partial [Hemibagrus guttatus]